MNPKDKKTMDRREFVRSGTITIVAANYLGFGKAVVHAAPALPLLTVDAVDIMKAAAAGVLEINQFFKKAAAELENMKQTKAAVDQDLCADKDLCMKILVIITAVVIVVVAVVVTAFTFGAGASMTALAVTEAIFRIDRALSELVIWEAEITKQDKMTPEIRAAIQRFREITANVKDVVVARDIFFHLSQDRTHAAKLLEAVRAKHRATIEEMLKRDVPGSNVVVQDAKEDNGIFLNVRIGAFSHCLSSSGQCNGKQFVLTKSR